MMHAIVSFLVSWMQIMYLCPTYINSKHKLSNCNAASKQFSWYSINVSMFYCLHRSHVGIVHTDYVGCQRKSVLRSFGSFSSSLHDLDEIINLKCNKWRGSWIWVRVSTVYYSVSFLPNADVRMVCRPYLHKWFGACRFHYRVSLLL